ncbi:MAG: SET domain-containing protein-lysine N-methyltransferase [Hyphomicrobium sp.]|jgi:SET domain-containing protein|uniref:SET domain-containing protein n=1 Tax=Hyphomicrobium sp. CS1BSMeth3 TaxID=1892844 RepID=UPI000869380E|nr:SET domain-containing protein-lysine N-methyltransferase [Hyphomicrobium sp. CS1BSMeth3]MBN9259346.1 SET domain-containing protein-lysine N-methyltransferase [Hyphomicrobium sp.]MBN9266761.1 SET domain-containing protein-lysine N-methyltransferase [Hyphomicrobium sp.]MBN9277838.1 SET domain-containing protein-lysine N-methyltransferase [Hyphomicrobium sp.]ODT30908.1 MAG: SET domain-containing protein-lysine N-methyltransferase [Hyphomicrobium sp. SCN 65-11]
MMLVATSVRASAIEGVGVFAVDFIPAGTPIWALDERFDKVFTEEEVASFPKNVQDYFTRYGYPHMEREGFVVLELDNGRFMNHSMTPNTDFTRPDVGYAIADIHPGDELICNYFEFDRTFQGFEAPAIAVEPAYAVQKPNGVGSGISASL